MNEFKKMLEKEILPKYLYSFSKVIVGREQYVFPDRYFRILTIDDTKYGLLYADYLDDNLDFNLGVLKKGKVNIKRFLPLITNQEKYSLHFENEVCDNCFVLAKML